MADKKESVRDTEKPESSKNKKKNQKTRRQEDKNNGKNGLLLSYLSLSMTMMRTKMTTSDSLLPPHGNCSLTLALQFRSLLEFCCESTWSLFCVYPSFRFSFLTAGKFWRVARIS